MLLRAVFPLLTETTAIQCFVYNMSWISLLKLHLLDDLYLTLIVLSDDPLKSHSPCVHKVHTGPWKRIQSAHSESFIHNLKYDHVGKLSFYDQTPL